MKRLISSARLASVVSVVGCRRWSSSTRPETEKVKLKLMRDKRGEPMKPDEYPTYTPNSELELWKASNTAHYGDGAYPLFRALYKDLCDEMRREIHAKPPAPFDNFTVKHDVGSNFVTFERPAEGAKGRIFAYGEIKLADPNQKNDMLQFLNWYPVEVLIIKNKMVMHAAVCAVESNYHVRNVKMYEDPEGKLGDKFDLDVNYVRNQLLYDGPYMGHLEADHCRELWDVIFDHGINPETVKFFAEWVYYLEHVEYSNWSLKMQKALLPEGVECEEDVLTREERQELDLATEEWLPVRDM